MNSFPGMSANPAFARMLLDFSQLLGVSSFSPFNLLFITSQGCVKKIDTVSFVANVLASLKQPCAVIPSCGYLVQKLHRDGTQSRQTIHVKFHLHRFVYMEQHGNEHWFMPVSL